jgi:hypothetical protein
MLFLFFRLIQNCFTTFTATKSTIMSTAKRLQENHHKIIDRNESQWRKISMLTAYDYTMAKIVDTAGIDVILRFS